MNKIDWGAVLVEQLDFYWNAHFRPRLEGLSDDEYLWEPVEGCWSVRQRPDGTHVMDGMWPAPSPPPLTTVAWRMMHIGVECFVTRASTFFGNGTVPDDADMFDPRHVPSDLPATAARAVSFLDDAYAWWHSGVADLMTRT